MRASIRASSHWSASRPEGAPRRSASISSDRRDAFASGEFGAHGHRRRARAPQPRHHELAEAPALLEMRIARQDERRDAERLVGAKLSLDLLGIADDRETDARARESDTSPEILLHDER